MHGVEAGASAAAVLLGKSYLRFIAADMNVLISFDDLVRSFTCAAAAAAAAGCALRPHILKTLLPKIGQMTPTPNNISLTTNF